MAITEADQEALGMVRALTDLSQRLPPVSIDSSTPATLLRAARELQPLLPALLPGLLHTGGCLGLKDWAVKYVMGGVREGQQSSAQGLL